jgi:hypothetical protein
MTSTLFPLQMMVKYLGSEGHDWRKGPKLDVSVAQLVPAGGFEPFSMLYVCTAVKTLK